MSLPTREELGRLERMLRPAAVTLGAKVSVPVPQLSAFIQAARELLDIKGALEFLKSAPNDVKITLPAPLEDYVAVAKELGWKGSDGKG